MRNRNRIALSAVAAAICCAPVLAAAAAPAEPNVVATIAVAAKQPAGYCVVSAKVSDPKTNAVLSAPTIILRASSEASTNSADKGQTIEFKVKAAEACGGGDYTVTVTADGKVVHVLNGELQAKR